MPQYSNLNELAKRPYIEQAKWWLNGFWTEGAEAEAEKVWSIYHKFVELDPKKKDGQELDKVQSMKLMESQGQAMSASEFSAILKTVDTDGSGGMALIEYLSYKYGKSAEDILKSPQGSSTHEEEIDKAAQALAAVTDASNKVQAELAEQTEALAASKAAEEKAQADLDASTAAEAKAVEDKALALVAESNAKSKLEGDQAAEEQVRKSQQDMEAKVQALKDRVSNFDQKFAELDLKANDDSISAVQRNKAMAERDQMKSGGKRGIEQEIIAQESIHKKLVDKLKAAQSATAASSDSHASASGAARQAEESAKAAADAKAASASSASAAQSKRTELEDLMTKIEASQKDTEAKVKEAQEKLTNLKGQTAIAHGAVWWMEREIAEAQKYMPKKK